MSSLEHLSKKGKSYIKQLLQVAMADGKLDHAELNNLMQTAKKFDFTEEEIMAISNNMDSVKVAHPSGTKETFQLIFDLVWMMMVDGSVYKREMQICENLAMQMGFAPETIGELARFIKMNIANGVSAEETYQKLEKMF